MKAVRTRIVVLTLAALAASGCGILKKSTPKTPVLGERVAVLATEQDVAVDPATSALPFSLPVAEASTPSGRRPAATLRRRWVISRSASHSARPGRSPLEKAEASASGSLRHPSSETDELYTIDTQATVRAFDAQTGATAWATQVGYDKGNRASLFGGGVAFDNGRIYATNGLGYVAALDARNGGIVWQVHPTGPLRGSPTVVGDTLYVITQDNQIYSLKTSDGSTNWSQAAALEIAGIFGSASPAVGQGTVVAGFSSGELNAYRYENGRLVWQDQLARTSIRTSVASISDVDANPVIDSGQVLAVGQGGRMVSLELISGQRQWELNIAGISTPWIAGEWVYVVTDDAKLLCVSRSNGKVRWIAQLPAFRNEKAKRGPIGYKGPVLAGGRLIVVSSDGTLINVDPANGSFQSQTNIKAGVRLSPVVANQTLYILDDDGRLHAFRGG